MDIAERDRMPVVQEYGFWALRVPHSKGGSWETVGPYRHVLARSYDEAWQRFANKYTNGDVAYAKDNYSSAGPRVMSPAQAFVSKFTIGGRADWTWYRE